jgi:TRAP-type uncharacterized transport system fused permease subunit
MGGARIGVTAGVIGFLMSSVTMTGLGIKLTTMVGEWSGGSILVACLITMVICLFFGCGVPTIVSYLLVAILATPILIQMGVSTLQAHFFNLYFACLSAVSPPVAMSTLVASGIAGSSYIKTGITAFKICLSSFLIPYLIVFNPTVILKPPDLLTGATSMIAILMGIFTTNVVVTRFFLIRLDLADRVLFAFCPLFFFAYAFTLKYLFLITGIILFLLGGCRQLRRRSDERQWVETRYAVQDQDR